MSQDENYTLGSHQAGVAFESKEHLKEFLLNIKDKMGDRAAAPIYALSALNYVMNNPMAYELLDNENKEIARDIWLRLKQAGFQLNDPPLLFGDRPADNSAVVK